MSKFPIPDAALAQHTAVLGKTGSGKTSVAKAAVEHLVAQGARVCVLDPIKSDWWGLTSSTDGKKAGLPFQILGGPRGHVPLHPTSGKVIAELVASGALPLCILDMADFPPGGLAQFFNDFAPTLLRKMKGVVHLVMEEAHEFAPKERAGIGNENMLIHHAKKLATAGRSRGLRLILATQRIQALHNALLGSCDTMVALRLTAPADQKPVVDWLKANLDKDKAAEIAASLSKLKTGSGWVCSGDQAAVELVHFPRIKTYDNSATPEAGALGADDVRTAPVDVGKLRELVGTAVKEAEANDPKALKAALATAQAELAKMRKLPAAASQPVAKINAPDTGMKDRDAAFQLGLKQGHESGWRLGWVSGHQAGFSDGVSAAQDIFAATSKKAAEEVRSAVYISPDAPRRVPPRPADAPAATASEHRPVPSTARPTAAAPRAPSGSAGQRILDGLRELEVMGVTSAPRVLVAMMAGYSHLNSKGFVNAIGALRSGGQVDYVHEGVQLTAAGRREATEPEGEITTETIQARIVGLLGGASGKILEPLIEAHPRAMTRQDVASAAGYGHLNSKGFVNAIGRLRTLGFVDYPSSGEVIATKLLFPGGG